MSRILILANNDVGLYQFRKELIGELLKDNEVIISLPKGKLVKPLMEAGCKFLNTPVDRRGINPVTDIKFVDRKGNQTVMNPNKTYKVLTTDYLLRGKDGFVLFKKKKAINLIGTDSDLIRKYLKNNGSLPKLPENIKTISSFRE
jgi:hypothetical protein